MRTTCATIQAAMASTDTLNNAPLGHDLVSVFEELTTTHALCPNRVWAVARDTLPDLMPANPSLPMPGQELSSQPHAQCTYSFCELSQRDFTAVGQRHECRNQAFCSRLQGFFPRHLLDEAVSAGTSTVWHLSGRSMLAPPRPFLAVSHVWSDGTGAGAWPAGEVNKCLFAFFKRMAVQFDCEGIWWDTLCIPSEKVARAKAIGNIPANFENARVTLVHDLFLRQCEWVDAERACFAILMSPWFSRGWTALELIKSRKVKVIFKGDVIKDLDEDIMFDYWRSGIGTETTKSHEKATTIIRALRATSVYSLDDLLTTLGSRHTSWPKDMAIIAGLLAGVKVTSPIPGKDVWQQDIYKRILVRDGLIRTRYLFHESATVDKGFSWRPINLFDIPVADQFVPPASVTSGGDVIALWHVIQLPSGIENMCVWQSTHPLLKARLHRALAKPEECVLLAETSFPLGLVLGPQRVERVLLVRGVQRSDLSYFCCQRIGVLNLKLPWESDFFSTKARWVKTAVRVLGSSGGTSELGRPAWDVVQETLTDTVRDLLAEETQVSQAVTEPTQDASEAPEPLEASSVLISASREGDFDKVARCLHTLNADPNTKDEFGWTPLHHATWQKHVRVVEAIVGAGGDGTLQDGLGRHPLHLAAERGDWPTVKDLLIGNEKKLLELRCDRGRTVLHYAAWGGSVHVVEAILQQAKRHHVSLTEARDDNGDAALHVAAECGFAYVVAMLLSASTVGESRVPSMVDARRRNGFTPLHLAAIHGHRGVAHALLDEGADIEATDGVIGWTPLHCAADNGRSRVVSLLLERGANVNAQDGEVGWTPLHLAAMRGHQRVVQVLLEKGADQERADKYSWTPRLFAQMRKHEQVAELFTVADLGAQAEKPGWTSLHCLAMDENEGVTRFLARKLTEDEDKPKSTDSEEDRTVLEPAGSLSDNSTNVNEKSVGGRSSLLLVIKKNWSALAWAAEHGQDELVESLLDNGFDVNEKDAEGRPALVLAMKQGHDTTVKLLLSRGAEVPDSAMSDAARLGHVGIVHVLLDHGVSAWGVPRDKNPGLFEELTPLQIAAQEGHAAVVEALLNRAPGLDINKSVRRGYKVDRAVSLAVQRGHVAVVELLASRGAITNFDRGERQWPIHDAAGNGDVPMARLLLKLGASVNQAGYDYTTPLHDAVSGRHVDMVKFLLQNGAYVDAVAITTAWGTGAPDQYTPLDLAQGWHKNEEIANILLNHKEQQKRTGNIV